MSVRFLQNRDFRLTYKKAEAEILAFRYIIRTQRLPFKVRWLASVYLSQYRRRSKAKLTNYCFLSSRRRGYIRFTGLSRQQMRLLARDNKLPFILKASW